MARDEMDESFDEEELDEGFDEESDADLEEDLEDEELAGDDANDDESGDESGDIAGEDEEDLGDDDDVADGETPEVVVVPVDEDDDLVDDSDVELALDEVLAETILRTSVPDDDEDGAPDTDLVGEGVETILPKQDDEFRCASCRLLKKTSQLADPERLLCRDCV